jgi:asparagine synthase (glutamine-hydrolysing)
MPGIVGIISRESPEKNKLRLQRMLDSLMHEATYQKRIYVDENAGLYLGSVSHSGTFDDCMPVSNENGTVVLVFSGETFDDPSKVKKLEESGHSFERGCAAYLVHLYEEKGSAFYEELNGWFCGVLIDKRLGQAVLFNDRYGMRRLYYLEKEGSVWFSTEVKALIRIGATARAFDERGLTETIACGCPLENRTLFEGVRLLPGASRWVIRDKRIAEKSLYFDISTWENKDSLPYKDFYPRFRETFRHILPRYLTPNPTIGISLTGGLDTRMIMANAPFETRHISCYTFSGMYRDCYDATLARKIASICGQKYRIIRLSRDFLEEFPRFAEKTIRISEGTIDLSATPDLYTNTQAKEIGLVRLTGNYGSEVLRQTQWLKGNSRLPEIINPDLSDGIVKTKVLTDRLYTKHPLTFSLFIDGPWHEYGRYAVESSQLVQRTPYTDNDLVSLMYQAPPEVTASNTLSINLIADGNIELTHIPTDRGVPLDGKTPIKMLYRSFLEALFKAEYLFNYGAPQWLVQLEYYLPVLRLDKLFLGRHKYYHFRRWFRDELSGFIKEILLDERALKRSYINSKQVERMVKLHTSGSGNFTNQIHLALNLELTSRLLLDAPQT